MYAYFFVQKLFYSKQYELHDSTVRLFVFCFLLLLLGYVFVLLNIMIEET